MSLVIRSAAAWAVASLLALGSAHAQNGKALAVAQIVPLSGPLANVGKEISQISEAVIAEHNRSAGAVRLSLKTLDDGNNADQSAQLAQSVANEAVALLSCFGTTGCLAQQKVSEAWQLPLIGPIAGAATLRGPSAKHTFAVRASAAQEVQRLLGFVSAMGLTRMGVAVQDDGFGRAYAAELDKLQANFPQLQMERVVFDPKGSDYQPLIQGLRAGKPHALMLLANASHSTALLNAWKAQDNLPFVLNLAGQANALFAGRMQGYTGTAAFVTVVPSPWDNRSPLQRDYQRLAQEAKLPLSYLGFEAFINARLLTQAVQKAQASNARDLQKHLDAQRNLDLGGYTVSYADRRLGSTFTDLSLLRKDGSFKH